MLEIVAVAKCIGLLLLIILCSPYKCLVLMTLLKYFVFWNNPLAPHLYFGDKGEVELLHSSRWHIVDLFKLMD